MDPIVVFMVVVGVVAIFAVWYLTRSAPFDPSKPSLDDLAHFHGMFGFTPNDALKKRQQSMVNRKLLELAQSAKHGKSKASFETAKFTAIRFGYTIYRDGTVDDYLDAPARELFSTED